MLFLFMITGLTLFAQNKLRPDEQHAHLSVTVTDAKGNIRVGEEIVMIGTKSKKSFSGISDPRGKFEILIPKGDVYRIKVSAMGTEIDNSSLEVPNQPGLFTSEMIVRFEIPLSVTLENVLFETGSAKLNPISFKSLDDLVRFMKRKTTMVIEIAGHTDNVGKDESNRELSQKRADAVRVYIIEKGIAPNRVVAKGYGSVQPVADNGTEAGRRKNRRTEVHILKE